MSDDINKVKNSIQVKLMFDPLAYKLNPIRSVSYDFLTDAKSITDMSIGELRAIEFSLKTTIDNVIKPEIARRHKFRNLKPVTGKLMQ